MSIFDSHRVIKMYETELALRNSLFSMFHDQEALKLIKVARGYIVGVYINNLDKITTSFGCDAGCEILLWIKKRISNNFFNTAVMFDVNLLAFILNTDISRLELYKTFSSIKKDFLVCFFKYDALCVGLNVGIYKIKDCSLFEQSEIIRKSIVIKDK